MKASREALAFKYRPTAGSKQPLRKNRTMVLACRCRMEIGGGEREWVRLYCPNGHGWRIVVSEEVESLA